MFTLRIPTLNDSHNDIINMVSIMNSCESEILLSGHNQIIVDFSGCSYLRSNLYAYLVSVFDYFASEYKVSVVINWKSINKTLLAEMIQVGFAIEGHAQGAYRIAKYKTHRDATQYLKTEFFERDNLKLQPKLKNRIVGSITEMYINVFEHSFAKNLIAYSSSHYSEKNKELKLTISDNGNGIPRNVKFFLDDQSLSDDMCLSWASRKTNSTRNDSIPGGLGFFKLEEFIKVNNGKIEVYSEYGYLKFENSAYTKAIITPYIKGTIINITINCDNRYYFIID